MFLKMNQMEDRAEYGLGAVADDSSIASCVVGVRLKEEGRKKKSALGRRGKGTAREGAASLILKGVSAR